MKRELKSYVCVTNDSMHFLTQAKNSKDALRNLVNNSVDFRVIIKPDEELIIKVRKV
jgi:hypothetical protein